MCGKFEGVLQMHRYHPVDTVEYSTAQNVRYHPHKRCEFKESCTSTGGSRAILIGLLDLFVKAPEA